MIESCCFTHYRKNKPKKGLTACFPVFIYLLFYPWAEWENIEKQKNVSITCLGYGVGKCVYPQIQFLKGLFKTHLCLSKIFT